MAGSEIGRELERTEGDAVEREDGGAGGGEHATDLVVATLGEREEGFAGREEFERRGRAGLVFALEEKRAAGEELNRVFGYVAIERRAVGFGDFVLGRGEAMNELRLVGEEEEPRSVFVEATDGGDLRIATAPAIGEQRVDVGAFAFVVGADETEGFVQEKKETVGVVERLVVDLDVGGVRFLRDVASGFAADRDGAGGDPVAGFAAGAIAEAGEELVEAAHGMKNGRKKARKAQRGNGVCGPRNARKGAKEGSRGEAGFAGMRGW